MLWLNPLSGSCVGHAQDKPLKDSSVCGLEVWQNCFEGSGIVADRQGAL